MIFRRSSSRASRFFKLDAFYQEMVKGAIIVGAVVLDQWRQRRAATRS